MSAYHAIEPTTSPRLNSVGGTPDGIPRWVAAAVVVGALLTVAGAVISKAAPTILLEDSDRMTSAARISADYFFARNLPLAALSLALLALGARRMLAGCMVLTALIQTVDIVDELASGRFALVPGMTVFAVVFLVGASHLLGRAIWHAGAWRDGAAPGAAAEQA
jgi:hypothetical protein